MAAEVLGRAIAHCQEIHDDSEPVEVVLTHPAAWGRAARQRLHEAARRAGLPPAIKMMSEPVAAALEVASRDDIEDGGSLAVFDVGAGTFDVAVLVRQGERLEPVSTAGKNDLGGNRFDLELGNHLRNRVRRLGGAVNRIDFERAVRDMRHHLASDPAAGSTTAELSAGGEAVLLELDRQQHDHLLTPLVIEAVETFVQAIEAAGLSPGKLDQVIVSGGASRGPLIASLLGERIGRAVEQHQQPKTIVALGALRYGLLSDRDQARLNQSKRVPADLFHRAAARAAKKLG